LTVKVQFRAIPRGEHTFEYPEPLELTEATGIAVNQGGFVVVLGADVPGGQRGEKQVLGTFPPDAIAGVYTLDGSSRIVPGGPAMIGN